MCLYSTERRLKRAKEDITCYKYLSWDYFNRCLVTPVMAMKIKDEDIINGLKPLRAKGLVQREKNSCGGYYFEGGLIHAYINQVNTYGDSSVNIIFKCHIPKGTRYIQSKCDGSIAAKKIVFDELICWPDCHKGVMDGLPYDSNETTIKTTND